MTFDDACAPSSGFLLGDPVNPMRLTCTRFFILLCDELTATFDPTMRFKRSNSNLENFHDVFGVAAFSLLLTPWRDIS